jgi:hypothetical protein
LTNKPVAPKSNVRPLAEAANRCWHITVPSEHSLADALSPTYLLHRVKELRIGDEYILRSAADLFYVKCYIKGIDVDAGTISLVVLEAHDLASLPTIGFDYSDCAVRRDTGGWAVMNGDTRLRGEFATEAAAVTWLAEKRAEAIATMAGKVSG